MIPSHSTLAPTILSVIKLFYKNHSIICCLHSLPLSSGNYSLVISSHAYLEINTSIIQEICPLNLSHYAIDEFFVTEVFKFYCTQSIKQKFPFLKWFKPATRMPPQHQ